VTKLPESSDTSEDMVSSKRGGLHGTGNESHDEETNIEGATDMGSHRRSRDPEVTSPLCKPGETGEQLHPCNNSVPDSDPLPEEDVLVNSIEIGGTPSTEEKPEAVIQPQVDTQPQSVTQPQTVPQLQLVTQTEKVMHIKVVVDEVSIPDQQYLLPVDEGEAVRIQDGEESKALGEGELRSELPIQKKVPPIPAISKRITRSNLAQEEDVELKAPQPKRKKSKEGETKARNPSAVIRTAKKQNVVNLYCLFLFIFEIQYGKSSYHI
jgi:hypothetical protein